MSLDISAVQDSRLCNNRLLSADATEDDKVDNMGDTPSPWAECIIIYCCETLYSGLFEKFEFFFLNSQIICL